ncbi:MAG: PAS domain S-box protein [Myxococcales bacterium]|nr:PAS domain S-box protein [Myxococcales bacterium]
MEFEAKSLCQNIYRFIRLRLGDGVSDREVARRWAMEWKSFNALRHGRRQVPRIGELEDLARVLSVDAAFVFEVARGVPAERVHQLLLENDRETLSELLMTGVLAAHRVAASKERGYKAILDRVNDAIFTMDVQGRFQDVNRRLCAITGFSEGELLQRSFFDLLPPDRRPQLVGAAAAVYKAGEAHGATFPLVVRDGSVRVVELGLTRIDDELGRAIGIQAVAHDVTERGRLEEELRQQCATLKMTFDATPAACLLFARDGTILLGNRLVENVCEWTDEEVTGRNAFDVFGSPGPAGCPVTRSFISGKVEQQVSLVKNRRGEEVYVHRTAGPVLGADGKADKVVEILVDVTAQVRQGDPSVLAAWSKDLAPAAGSERLEDVEKRRFLRVLLEAPARYQAGGKRGEATVQNLGRGGVFVHADVGVPIASEISLEWVLPETRRRLRARGVVVWQLPASGGAPPGMGIKFVELPQRHQQAVVSFVGAKAKHLAPSRTSAPSSRSRTRAAGASRRRT